MSEVMYFSSVVFRDGGGHHLGEEIDEGETVECICSAKVLGRDWIAVSLTDASDTYYPVDLIESITRDPTVLDVWGFGDMG